MTTSSLHTVLVTDGEQRAALAVVRSLGALGYPVHVASASGRSLAGASRYAAHDWLIPDPLEQPTEAGAAIERIAHEIGARIVIPISEASLLAVLPRRGTIGACLPFPEMETFQRISHKGILLDQARELGISIPAQHVLNTPADIEQLPRDLSYPLVIKPSRSVADTGESRAKLAVQHVATPAELHKALAELDQHTYPLLLQQRIVGPGVGIFMLVWNDEVIATFSHERIREKPPSGGVSVYRKSRAMDEVLLEKSRALLQAFQWQGVAMIEYKLDAATGTPFLMEVNGRFWGSLQLAVDAGVDFPALLVRAASDEKPAPVTTYDLHTSNRWLLGDVDHLITRLKHSDGYLALPPGSPSRLEMMFDFFRYIPGRHVETFQWNDQRPFRRELKLWANELLGRGANA